MATITISESGRGDTPVTVIINGIKYSIPRGASVTVPDAVAAEIQKLGIELRETADDQTMWALPRVSAADNDKILRVSGGKWALEDIPSELPAVDAVSDAGKVLTVVDGAWAPAAASGGGGGVLVVHDVDGTLDKTWQEIVDADLAVVRSDGETVGSATVIPSWEVDSGYYNIYAGGDSYTADSASGYPVKNIDDGGMA